MSHNFFAPAALTCVFALSLLSNGAQAGTAVRKDFSLVTQAQPGGQCRNNHKHVLEQIKKKIQYTLLSYSSSIPIGYAIGIKCDSLQTIIFMGNNYENNQSKFVLKSQNGSWLTLDEDTPFEIGSSTKTFTATLYAKALFEQTVSPKATLGQYLQPNPSLPQTIQNLKLEQLATYSSGLPKDDAPVPNTSPPHPVNLKYPYQLNQTTPPNQPGLYPYLHGCQDPHYRRNCSWITNVTKNVGSYAYSNLGFSLLALALPKALSPSTRTTSYENLMSEAILSKLGMSATHFYTPADNASLPIGIVGTNGGRGLPHNNTWPAYNGAGGIVTTPADMMTWLLFNMGVKQETGLTPLLRVLQTPHPTVKNPHKDCTIGLAWELCSLNGLKIVQKNGGVPSFNSWIGFTQSSNPSTQPAQTGVFLLTNSSNSSTNDSLAKDILLILNRKTP